MAASESLRSLGVNEMCGTRAEHTHTHTCTGLLCIEYCTVQWIQNARTQTRVHTNPDKSKMCVHNKHCSAYLFVFRSFSKSSCHNEKL